MGCKNQHRYQIFIYLVTLVSSTFKFKIDRSTGALGYGKYSVDGLNIRDKRPTIRINEHSI